MCLHCVQVGHAGYILNVGLIFSYILNVPQNESSIPDVPSPVHNAGTLQEHLSTTIQLLLAITLQAHVDVTFQM